MKHTIELNGIKLYAYHGCLKEESIIGGHYIVDVLLTTDFSEASKSDDLTQTIDYVLINKIVKEEMGIRSKLIEHVGRRIYDRMFNEIKNIFRLKIKIRKLVPPINGNVNEVSITIDSD